MTAERKRKRKRKQITSFFCFLHATAWTSSRIPTTPLIVYSSIISQPVKASIRSHNINMGHYSSSSIPSYSNRGDSHSNVFFAFVLSTSSNNHNHKYCDRKRTVQKHGRILELVCGFGYPKYNTMMETVADTELYTKKWNSLDVTRDNYNSLDEVPITDDLEHNTGLRGAISPWTVKRSSDGHSLDRLEPSKSLQEYVPRQNYLLHSDTRNGMQAQQLSHMDPLPMVPLPLEYNGYHQHQQYNNGDDNDDGETYMTLREKENIKFRIQRTFGNVWKTNQGNKRDVNNNRLPEHNDFPNKKANNMNHHSHDHNDNDASPRRITIRSLWKRRHARSIEEGIRREKLNTVVTTEQQLSNILDETSNVHLDEETDRDGKGRKKKGRRYAARTIAGLISALAEEATGLEVQVDARNDTPFWGKHIDTVKINFSRLGVKALRMGGLDEALMDVGETLSPFEKETMAESLHEEAMKPFKTNTSALKDHGTSSNSNNSNSNSVDEIFDRIDVDNSGALDEEELARALSIASGLSNDLDIGEKSAPALSKLASRLISIYDTNGDGVVDREEYRKLVEDMTSVRDTQRIKQREREEKLQESLDKRWGIHPLKWMRMMTHIFHRWSSKDSQEAVIEQTSLVDSKPSTNSVIKSDKVVEFEAASDISDDPSVISTISKSEGSIILSDLKLDLRRLLFGAVPIVKHITPGGPLILEPFTMTLKGSFTREDILDSALLDDGLRRLVARALRRRVRSLRDLLDGAVFYGRTWNMASKQAPVVEVPKLTNIEFDAQDRMIITGRAKVRTSPDQPFVENSFKLRTKLGTRENGHVIRLEDPELALVLECPKAWERNIVAACKNLKMPIPRKPEPLYQFIPLVSPIKKTEQDGFNLGEDNNIKSIYVKDNALRFEISSVLRPGRFLGNHYLAFTVPNRTFIVTMDRIREGIRAARQNKRQLARSKQEAETVKKNLASERYNRAFVQALSSSASINSDVENADLSYKKELDDLSFIDPDNEVKTSLEKSEIVTNRPGFFGRFLEGYLEAAREETERERNEHLTTAISEFFSPAGAEDQR